MTEQAFSVETLPYVGKPVRANVTNQNGRVVVRSVPYSTAVRVCDRMNADHLAGALYALQAASLTVPAPEVSGLAAQRAVQRMNARSSVRRAIAARMRNEPVHLRMTKSVIRAWYEREAE